MKLAVITLISALIFCLLQCHALAPATLQQNHGIRHDLAPKCRNPWENCPCGTKQLSPMMIAATNAVGVMFWVIAMTASTAAFADEIGVEKDAPTLYTGETVEICTKRGPLGACLKTEYRTEENDNDKAKQYFRASAPLIRERDQVLQGFYAEESQGNALIERLQRQTEENREKNRLDVERKTFENDQSATFGPFDRQAVIMNVDGKTFTLLQSSQVSRLEKAGFIRDRKFVAQPTEEEIANALEAEGGGLAGALQSWFSGNK